MHQSIDGFACTDAGDVDWIFDSMDDDMIAWMDDTIWQAGAHLMGSNTYREMAAHWPHSDEVFAEAMNAIPKAVFSQTLDHPCWSETCVVKGDLRAEILSLKADDGKHLLAHGGISFARSLIRENLIDEYLILTHPVILGRGKTIFSSVSAIRPMLLAESITFPGGAVLHRLVRATG